MYSFFFQTLENLKLNSTGTAKVIWPEFIRKMTILILFDRINSDHFRPQYFRPKIFDQAMTERLIKQSNEVKLQQFNDESTNELHKIISDSTLSINNKKLNVSTDYSDSKITGWNNNETSYNKSKTVDSKMRLPPIEQTSSFQLFMEPSEKEFEKSHINNYFSVDEVMSDNMQLDNYKPHLDNEFGSFQYVIRSRHFFSNKSDDHLSSNDDLFSEFTYDLGLGDLNRSNRVKFGKNNLKPINTSFRFKNNKQNQFNNQISDSLETFKTTKPNNLSYLRLNKLNQQPNSDNDNGTVIASQYSYNLNTSISQSKSVKPYEYDKISNDIYKIFGRTKPPINYPQQLSNLNKISKSNDYVNGSNVSSGSTDKLLNIKNHLNLFSDDMTSAKNMLNYNVETETDLTDIGKYLIKKSKKGVVSNPSNAKVDDNSSIFDTAALIKSPALMKMNKSKTNRNNLIDVKLNPITHLKSMTSTPT
jgi:hypothetical protein